MPWGGSESPESPESVGWGGELDPFSDPDEKQVIFSTLDSFRQYRKQTHLNTTHRRRQNIFALPSPQWRMLSSPPFSLLENLNAVDDAIDHNAEIADHILSLGLRIFGLPAFPTKDSQTYWHDTAKPNDMAKAHSTIRQFYRDWSAEGYAAEVQTIMETILSDLMSSLPTPSLSSASASSSTPTLLLPGAGLARLLFNLSMAGYNVEGNEISYHQLLASNWILNSTLPLRNTPSIHSPQPSQIFTRAQQLKSVQIPDIHPGAAVAALQKQDAPAAVPIGEMNMVAGDFIVVYSSPSNAARFDAVITVFFLDTAPNVLRYIDTMKNCLRPGGVWINIGPLLWHYDAQDRNEGSNPSSRKTSIDQHHTHGHSDCHSHSSDHSGHSQYAQTQERHGHKQENSEDIEMILTDNTNAQQAQEKLRGTDVDTGIGGPGSFELTDEEVAHLLESSGFIIEKREMLQNKTTGADGAIYSFVGFGYIQDPESMLQNLYRVSHWVARKL